MQRCAYLFIFTIFAAFSAFGAAWTSEKGHGQVILTSSWFQTGKGWDQSGRMQPFGYNGKFRKIDFNPYIELGVAKGTSLLINAFVPNLRYSNEYGSSSSFGTGDMEVGMRRRLTPASSKTVVSVQGLVSFPTYDMSRTPPPGNHQIDIEPRILVGRGYQLEGASVFWDAEAAMRLRRGAPADQVRLDGTLGANLNSRVMVMGQVFGIVGLRNGEPFRVGTNPNLQSDFDLGKVQASTVFRLVGRTRLQTAVFQTFTGRNTGYARGALISLWFGF